MGLLDRIAEQMRPQAAAYPVGQADALGWMDGGFGHDDATFSPEKYGDYLVTSNEVYSVISLRARLRSSLKLRTFRGLGENKSEVSTGPVADLLHHVNPYWTFPRLIRMDELCMGAWGESFWYIAKSPSGVPKEIWWLKPSRMRPVPDATGYLSGFIYESAFGEPIAFTADEIVWQRYPNPLDEFAPMSPLAAARLAADTTNAMQKANKNLFDQGLMAGGLIVPETDKVTFSEEQARELEVLLDRRLKGVDKAHRWSVLRYEAQIKGLNVTPREAEWVSGMQMSLRQVCNVYGVPAPLMNDPASATLANVREFQRQLWEHSLQPDADFAAAEIEEQLLPMFGTRPGRQTVDHVEWDYSKVPALQESTSEVWTRDRQMIEVGAMTINEWRKQKGMPPVEWGDVFWAPVNKQPTDDAETDPPANAPPPPVAPAADPEDVATSNAVRSIRQQFDDLTANLGALGYTGGTGNA
jgi:HK97 family phage portal protein